MNKCDICGKKTKNIKAGRWIFYCPEHKHRDWEITYENELEGVENWSDIDIDGELSDMIEKNAL